MTTATILIFHDDNQLAPGVEVDISQDAPSATFGPAPPGGWTVTRIEARTPEGTLLFSQTPDPPVEVAAGTTHTFSIGSTQYGDAP